MLLSQFILPSPSPAVSTTEEDSRFCQALGRDAPERRTSWGEDSRVQFRWRAELRIHVKARLLEGFGSRDGNERK